MLGLMDYGYGPMTPRTRAGLLNDLLSEARPSEAQKAASWWYDLVKPYVGERTARNVEGGARTLVDTSPIPAAVAAYEDPSLGSVTNAGVHGLLSLGRPLQALKLLGAAYGGAGAKDLGLLDALAPASAEAKKDSKAKTPAAARLPGLSDEDNSAYQGIMARLSAGDFSGGAERRALEAQAKIFTDKAGLAGQRDAELTAAKAAADKAEFDRQVGVAEKARDAARARDRRFSSTETGKVWETTGGLAPFAAGALLGGFGRAASGGGSTFKNYTAPAFVGGMTGAASSNIPLAYNAFMTEPDNPEAVAAAAYARELPDTHPKKQQAMEYAAQVPPANPVREAASKELYDPVKAAERMTFGALEGIGGGLFGADLVRMPGRVLEGIAAVPGRMSTAAQSARPPSPQGPTGGAGGNGRSPAGGLLPPAAPVPQQNILPPPAPGPQGSRPVSYGKAQQKVARALVDSDVSIGGAVPSANALENAYRVAGVKVPTAIPYKNRITDTQKLVSEMQARGMSGPEIVKALQAYRAQGAKILGIGAAGALAAPGLLDFGDGP